jgi:hypothetical protein
MILNAHKNSGCASHMLTCACFFCSLQSIKPSLESSEIRLNCACTPCDLGLLHGHCHGQEVEV